MEWSQAAAHYKELLRASLNVQRHALYVADIKATNVSPELRQALIRGSEPIQRQLERLEKGEFRIAVVGLEKAGKSTFINAWLASDLLPTASERCTFTTTQIYSVVNNTEQQLEVTAKRPEQFDAYYAELKQAAPLRDSARKDLETVEQHLASLHEVVRRGSWTKHFTRIEEIGPLLRQYVADASVAHAIEEVRLYTSRLAKTAGIVFFDVPGLNSGLGKHLEESRAMLADCDAVICLQTSYKPSLEGYEQKLVEFVAEGDEAVGIAGKLFVFAGQIDRQGSAQAREENLRKICEEWRKHGNLPADRIIPGSAAAYLLFVGAASEEIRKNAGDEQDIRRKLAQVWGFGEQIADEALLEASGIPLIQQRIERYLSEERAAVLQQRCDEPIARIVSTAREIYRTVSQHFSENPDEARRQENNRRIMLFQQWWGRRWDEIVPAVNRYFKEHFDSEDGAPEVESIKKLHTRYRQLVSEGLAMLPAFAPQRRDDIFDTVSRPVFDARIANDAWRQELYDHDIQDFLHDMAARLSFELLEDTRSFVNFMKAQLWGSGEVERVLFDEHTLKVQLESGLRALFLRFARPVAEALIRGPLASERRREIVRKLGMDVELLDNYYEGEEPALKELKRYVKFGRTLLDNPAVRSAVLGMGSQTALAVEAINQLAREQPQPAMTREEVIAEVEADLRALEIYLTEVVFSAAGFAAYLSQELKRLRDRFASNEDIWAAVARIEYEAENPALLNQLPPELKTTTFDVEVSERLRQLRLALEDLEPAS